MSNKYLLIIFMVCVMWLAGCGPDPRRDAQAFAIQEKAEQDALNQTQQRAQNADVHALELQRLQIEQGHREQTAAEWRAGLNQFIHYGFMAGTIGLCMLILVAAVSISSASVGLSQAMVQAAQLRAHLIPLDEKTRQYPALLHYVGHGKYLMVNANVNGSLELDSRNEVDRQMIAISGAVLVAGMMGREARLSADPAAISIIKPVVIKSEADHE